MSFKITNFKKIAVFISFLPMLAACSQETLYNNKMVEEAKVTDRTVAGKLLANLPRPTRKIPVSLYEFQDQTGQFKYNGKYTDYSSAVTKGGHAILTKALLDAGNKTWFTVAERGGLKDLLQERQIIKIMRSQYVGADGQKLPNLPPMVYGGMLIEGGIVSYDSNVVTGGMGAVYLGIGGSVQYRRDIVTVYLRAVSTQNGEVLLSVTSSKTIFSTALDANLLKYISFDKLLQAEAGFSVNEPAQLGVRQAIETAVYSLVMEGALSNVWRFKDPAAGQDAINEYLERRDNATPSVLEAHDETSVSPSEIQADEIAEPKILPKPTENPSINPKSGTRARTKPKVKAKIEEAPVLEEEARLKDDIKQEEEKLAEEARQKVEVKATSISSSEYPDRKIVYGKEEF